jgi:hypothetical protein
MSDIQDSLYSTQFQKPKAADETPKAESSFARLGKALKLDLSPFEDIYAKEAKAKGEVAQAQQSQKETEAKGKLKGYQDYAAGLKEKYTAAEPILMSAPPKLNISKDTQEGLTGLAALMTVGSLIIGSKGAMSGTNAMNAMTGVLKGYQEGNKERIDFETKKYEREMDNWKTAVQQTRDSLARYEKLASSDLNTATAKATADAISKGQTVIAKQIEQEGISNVRARMDKMLDQTMTISSSLRTAMEEATGGVGSRGALGKMLGAEVAARTPLKEAEKIVGGVNSIKSTMDLVKKAQDPEIKFGELGRIGTTIEAAWRRNLGSDQNELSPQALNAAIDQAATEASLDPNDKNVVFYKEAVFTALELERQARGGSILPVAVMKTLTPLLDPRNTTKAAYVEILRRRAQDVARSTGLSQEQLNSALSQSSNVYIGMPGAARPSAPGATNEADPLGLR